MVRNGRVAAGALRSWWDLPGGAVRAGEALPEALRREWREETGLAVTVGDLVLVADGAKRGRDGIVLYTWRAFFFEVTSAGAPRAGAGIDAVAWVPEHELIARLEAPYHAALRDWLRGRSARYATIDWVEDAPEGRGAAGLPRDLLIVAAAGAVGDADLVRAQVARALDGGETVARVRETLLQLVPYAGYPRGIAAFRAARPRLGAEPVTTAALEGTGAEVFARVYGDTAASVRAGLEALHPELAAWTLEHAYGRVLARGGALTLLERELLAVAILTALGNLADPLLGHMRAARRLGASVAQVEGAVRVVPASVGEARKAQALALLARL
jgi:alkylhydroperoxidase/carboxymuconolactone decarboxylase family protein YurZ/ADP-ribose pyrophosphatase YjhB (NUDIX family)